MATTTNFGWETPDDTDLVKDGAAAMRTLGSAIDTSFVDLKGGTTGQVLSKASNTDLDYTWVTQDDANAIQNAIVDAKGDLIAATANDTPARLAVGNNGEVLIADSSTATGLRYTAGTVQGNPVLNSAFQVWQRGTSISNFGFFILYTADRWQFNSINTGRTISRQVTGDTTNLPSVQYCARIQRDSTNTDITANRFAQSFETLNSIPFAGKTITLSFYARKGANYSATSNVLNAQIVSGTGTDQNVITGYTGQVVEISTNFTLTSTWQRFTTSGLLTSTLTELATVFNSTPTGTAGAADYFEVTGVQIDIGSVALPFRTYAGTIQQELAACRRYLPAITTPSGFGQAFFGYAYATNGGVYSVPFDVQARVAPTGISIPTVSGSTFIGYNKTNNDIGVTAISFDVASVNGATILSTGTLTQGDATRLLVKGSAGYILFTGCEL